MKIKYTFIDNKLLHFPYANVKTFKNTSHLIDPLQVSSKLVLHTYMYNFIKFNEELMQLLYFPLQSIPDLKTCLLAL